MHEQDAIDEARAEINSRSIAPSSADDFQCRGAYVLRRLREDGFSVCYNGLIELAEQDGVAISTIEQWRSKLRYELAIRILAMAVDGDEGADRDAPGQLGDGLANLRVERRQPIDENDEPKHERYVTDARARDGDQARNALGPAQQHAEERGYTDWRLDLLHNAPARLFLPLLVQAVIGCRPAEMLSGVGVKVAGRSIAVAVTGAKIDNRGGKGQPHRGFALTPGRGDTMARMLRRIAYRAGGEIWVTLPPADDPPDAYCTAVRRFVRRLGYEGVSAYCFRHQARVDLRAADASREEVAGAMGHRTTRSQQVYGDLELGRAGGLTLSHVDTARPIKEHPRVKDPTAETRVEQTVGRAALEPKPEPDHGPVPE